MHYVIEILYLLTLYYAIVKYDIIDVDVVWRQVVKNIIYFCIFLIAILCLSFGVYNSYSSIIVTSILFIFYLVYSKQKIYDSLNKLFIKKYIIVQENLKAVGKIKNDIYDKEKIANILVKEISSILDLTYAAYFECNREEKKLQIDCRLFNRSNG